MTDDVTTNETTGALAPVPEAEAAAVLGGPTGAMVPLGHSTLGPTRGVWRVTGPGGVRAILKVVGQRDDERAEASRRQTSYQFWAREPAILAEGVPAAYREAGIRGPRLLARFERPDRAVALWLEEAAGRSGADLSIADLASFARRLGVAQGRIAAEGGGTASVATNAGVPATAPAWASRAFLRDYAADRPIEPGSSWRLEPDDPRWDRPSMAVIDRPLRDALIRLQRERETFIGWVEAGPRTLAHLDVWPTNVFVDTDGSVTLIDWAFAGDGALGEDIGNLVPDAVFDLLHPPTLLGALDEATFAAYVDGLRAAGWTGDEREVRLAMCASAVKYDCIAAGMLARSDRADQTTYGTAPAVSTEELFAVRATVMRFLAGWADEARRLAAELGRA